MGRFLPVVGGILAAGCFVYVNASADSSCVTIDSPRQGIVVTTPLCTVSVAACDQVAAVGFTAHFAVPNAKGDTALLLGRITHPPFKLIWNTDDLPNQLYKGMSFSIDASFKNGQRISRSVSGIFVANKSAVCPVASIPFSGSTGFPLFTRTASSSRSSLDVRVSACWNREGIRFLAEAEAPAIFNGAAKGKLGEAGLEICIDPGLSRKPYPPQNAFSLVIPLEGTPFKTLYRPMPGPSGSFDIATSKEPCTCRYEISKLDVKGFRASVVVPLSFFGRELPDSFGCNVVVRLPDENNQIVRLSWVEAPAGAMFSPYLWASVLLLPRPFYSDPLTLLLLSFGAGLTCTLLIGLIVLFVRRKSVSFEKFEQSEEEKKLSDQIYQIIDESVTRKDITLGGVAEKLAMPPGRVEKLIRKHKGKTFKEFITFLRIEIAKERLRSSHSSETSIAESCGFKNVAEMEKYFKKLCRTTALEFRKENQVA